MTDRRPIEFVAARLEQHECRPRRRGDQIRAFCPVHGGNTRALHVAVNQRGDVLLVCHYGCDTERILDELGFAWTDLFAEGNPRTRTNPEGGSSPSQARKPCPWSLGSSQRPELYDLLDAYERGELQPEPVQLGQLPARAGEDDRRVASDIALSIGLRRADGETRPLPYAERFCAARMGWDGEAGRERARRVLRRLVRWGVIDRAGEMQRRPDMPRGTMTYTAPSPPAAAAGAGDVALKAGVESREQSQDGEARQDNSVTGDVIGGGEMRIRRWRQVRERHERQRAAGAPTLADLTDEELRADFFGSRVENVEKVTDDDGAGETPASVAIDCPHSTHAGREWRLVASDRWTCGLCHPPVAGLDVVWAREEEKAA